MTKRNNVVTEKRELKLLNVDEMIKAAPDKYPFLVDELILDVGVTFLSGAAKVGKSTLARLLARHIVDGGMFLNRFEVVLPGSVLYLILEGNEMVIAKNFAALAPKQKYGRLLISNERMPADYNEGLAMLEDAIKRVGDVRCVFVDTILKLLRIPDNDNYVAVTNAMEDLEAMAKRLRVQIIPLGHVNKREVKDVASAMMGSSANRAATDANILMFREGDMNGPRLIQTEQRAGAGIEDPTYLVLDKETQQLTLGSTQAEKKEERREDSKQSNVHAIAASIRDVLLEHPQGIKTGPLLGLAKGGSTQRKSDVLKGMQASGEVLTKNEGNSVLNFLLLLPAESIKPTAEPKVVEMPAQAAKQTPKYGSPEFWEERRNQWNQQQEARRLAGNLA